MAVNGMGQNLIPNGDFELGPDSSSTGWIAWADTTCTDVLPMDGPDFWINISSSPDRMVEGGVFTCNWDNDTAQSGKAWVDFGWNDEAGKTTLISPLEIDSFYLLQGYIKLETYQGVVTQPHRLAFVFNNSGDSIVLPYSNSQWQYFDTLFVASANSTEIKITSIEMVGSATKVDNISLQKVSSTSINEINNLKKLIVIYPNPANDYITINTNKTNVFNVGVFNTLGTFLFSKQLNNQTPLHVGHLAKGIYILEIDTGKEIQSKKIIIQ